MSRVPEVYIRDANGDIVNSKHFTVPADRRFREAWVRTGPVIEVDMDKARQLFRATAKRAVGERIKDNVVAAFIDATLNNDAAALVALKRDFNIAKAIDTHQDIDDAETVEDLVQLWDQHVDKLGPNPFSTNTPVPLQVEAARNRGR